MRLLFSCRILSAFLIVTLLSACNAIHMQTGIRDIDNIIGLYNDTAQIGRAADMAMKGEREMTLADIMDMPVKEKMSVVSILKVMGKPNTEYDLGNGYKMFEWSVKDCTRQYFSDPKQVVIGWNYKGCSLGKYGHMKSRLPQSTPIPVANGARLYRQRDTLDYLYLSLGKPADSVIKTLGKSTSVSNIGANKRLVRISRSWNTYRREVDGYEWACWGVMCTSSDTYVTIKDTHNCNMTITTDSAGRLSGWDMRQCAKSNFTSDTYGKYISTKIPKPGLYKN